MDLANLRRRKRIKIAPPQMIIVRAEHDILIGFTGEIGEHVVDGGACGFNIDLQREMKIVRKRKRGRLGDGIDLLLNVGQGLTGCTEPRLRSLILHLYQHDAAVDRAAHAAKIRQQIFFSRAQFAVYQDDGFGSVISRVDRFGNELRMLGESRLVVAGEPRRLITQKDNNLVFYVETRVVVIAELGCGSAIAHEHKSATGDAGGGKAKGNKILIEL